MNGIKKNIEQEKMQFREIKLQQNFIQYHHNVWHRDK